MNDNVEERLILPNTNEYLSVNQAPVINKQTYIAILALSMGTFAINTNALMPISFLSEIADTYEISIPTAAWVMSSFMLGCAVSAPNITLLMANMEYKKLLISLEMLLAVSGSICSLAPSFSILIIGRILSSFTFASYMNLGATTVQDLVHHSKKEYVTSLFFTGTILSNILGIPLSTWISQNFSWRYSFGPVIGLAALSACITSFCLPNNIKNTLPLNRNSVNVTQSIPWLALLASTFEYAGAFSSHTYFANMMTQSAGYSNQSIVWLTLIYGAGSVMGHSCGSKISNKNLQNAISIQFAILAGLLFAFSFAQNYQYPAVASLFASGFAGSFLNHSLMNYIKEQYSEEKNMIHSFNQSALGLGAFLGIFLSGLAIDNGYGYQAPNWIGCSYVTIGFIVFILNKYLQERTIKPEYSLSSDDESVGSVTSFVTVSF